MTTTPPLANRGPEALHALLLRDEVRVAENLSLLTRSELVALGVAAERLASMARKVIGDPS